MSVERETLKTSNYRRQERRDKGKKEGRERRKEGREGRKGEKEGGRRQEVSICVWAPCMKTPIEWVETSRKVLGEPGIPLSPEGRMKAFKRSSEVSLALCDVETVEPDCEGRVCIDGSEIVFQVAQGLYRAFTGSSAGKDSPVMQETLVRFLGWKVPLEKG